MDQEITGKLKHLSLLFVLLVSCTWVSLAQETGLNMEIVTVSDGLCSNCVYAVVQDKDGYMWFGTDNGLDRYDGKTFRHYEHCTGKDFCLSDSRINCLIVSQSDGLLAGTEKGINVYVPEKDIFEPYRLSAEINGEVIRTMVEEDSLLWVGTNNGLYCLDRQNGKVSRFDTSNSGLAHNIVRAVYLDSDYIFVGAFNGLSRLNRRNGAWKTINLKMDYIKYPLNNLVLYIQPSPDNPETLLIGMQTGLCELNKYSLEYEIRDRTTDKEMINNTIKTICVVKDNIWLGTEDGLMVYDGADEFIPYSYDPADLHSLPNNVVWQIYKDRGGIVWLATEGGVAYYDSNIPTFDKYDLTGAEGNDYVGISVFAAVKDKSGKIWLGSRYGLSYYLPESDVMHWIDLPNAVTGTYNFVRGLAIDGNDILWIGTAEGLLCLDTVSGSFISVPGMSVDKLKYINIVKPLDPGSLSVCDVYGRMQIIKYDFDTRNRYFRSASDTLISIGETVEAMEYDGENFWFGTAGSGLIKIDRKTGETTRYLYSDDPSGISCDVVHNVYYDWKAGRLWVGTGRGIDSYDSDTDTFFTEPELNLNESVYTMAVDDSGVLWFTTMYNVDCYDENAGTLKIFPINYWFNKRESLCPISFSDGDDVYIFGVDNFLRMNRADIVDDTGKSPLYISDILIDNRPYYELKPGSGPVHALRKLTLPHDQNMISVSFAMLDYSSPAMISYTYRLSGYDTDWRTVSGAVPYVEYTKLKPGKYVLEANAVGCDGMPASNSLSFEIRIRSPWWFSWVAWVLYIMLFTAGVASIISMVRRKQSAEKELQKEKMEREKSEGINQLKLNFFTNISHDFRTPISLILSPVESLMETETDPGRKNNLNIIRQNAQRLLRLVNQILDFKKVEEQKMELDCTSGDFVAELSEICQSFMELAQKKGVSLLFETETEHLVMDFDKDKIGKIFFNLISNSLKFTSEGGQVIVSLSRKDQKNIEVMVADTGIGIPSNALPHIFERFYQVEEHAGFAAKGSGIGLIIVKEFVELHHGRIEVMSKSNVGTTFMVSLPVVNELAFSEPETNETSSALILLVEDNEDMASYLETELGRYYSVRTIDNAEAGQKLVTELMPDLIISDVMLPGISGVEFCRNIKDNFVTSHIPVILLTARTAEEHVIEGFNAGADEYIGKPFNLKVLLSRVDNILKQREQLRKSLRKDIIDLKEVDRMSPDEIFIHKVVALVEENIADSQLDIPFLCDRLAVSHVNLYRKIKSITGMSVNAFIREIRIKKAGQLLKLKGITVSEVMYDVGFSHRSYFSKCFVEVFGMTPKNYAKQYNNDYEEE